MPEANPQDSLPAEPTFNPQLSASSDAPPPFSVREWLSKEGGVDGNEFESDEAALKALYRVAEQGRSLDPNTMAYVRAGQWAQELQEDQEFQEWYTQREEKRRTKPQQQEPAPQQPATEWPVEELDPRWEKHVAYDPQTGTWVLRPESAGLVAPSVAERYGKAKEWELNTLRKIAREFPQLTQSQVMPLVEQLRQEIYESLPQYFSYWQQEQQGQAYLHNYLQHRHHDIFVTDAQGNIQYDPVTKREILKPFGEMFYQHAARAFQMGEQNPTHRAMHAIEMAERDLHMYQQQQQSPPTAEPAEAPPPPPTAQQRNAVRKEKFIQKAIREQKEEDGAGFTNSRNGKGGSEAAAADLDWDSMLNEEMDSRGMILRSR